MKRLGAALAMIVALLGGMTAAETASAHGGHTHIGVGVGFGFGPYWPGYWPGYWGAPYPYYYPAPYYYEPMVTTPPTYIERGDEARPSEARPSASSASGPRRDWWYFCPETKTYYPYVKDCAGGWQRVEPKPQAENETTR